ncbi:MAG: ribonuclease HII [Eubacteriales bacterium]
MLESEFDLKFAREYGVVCGCDEAGRGPLAGPVVAAAVVLPENCAIEGLDDSKKLTEKKRESLYGEICEKALAYGIAQCSSGEIDEMNILAASLFAMKKAVDEVRLTLEPNIVLVDGNRNRDFGVPSLPIVHGDAKSQSIAAASVLAKVTRDRLMVELDEKYPLYNFKKHKGYPTKEHMLAVFEHGPCEIHRKTFLSFLEKDRDNLSLELEKKRAAEESGK